MFKHPVNFCSPLRLADFNIVPCPWGQSSGKTANLSNDSFLSFLSYLDARAKQEVALGLSGRRMLSKIPYVRHLSVPYSDV